jgi:alpha-L-rhamnosidase
MVSDAWLQQGFSAEGWTSVHVGVLDIGTLVPYIGPPIRRQEEVASVRIWTSPAGKTLADFAQNLVGWVRVCVQGPAGTTVTLRHSEVLEHEELGTRPLRTAKATDRFTLSGAEDLFEPTFTFHGFRYMAVDGWPELTPDALTAVVLSSDLNRIGELECSEELLNQLHRNVVWGTRGNFLDVPPTAPSGTSGSAEPGTSPSSPPRRRSCWTSRASCATGWSTSPSSSGPPPAACPSWFPMS